MKIAIVHDYLIQYGGAERVVEVFHEIFPDAPIYTSIYAPHLIPKSFEQMDIRTSFLQRLPFATGRVQRGFLLLYPIAFQLFDLRKYDLVFSSSSAWAKGVATSLETCHINYCHAPMRFAWSYNEYVDQENLPSVVKILLPSVLTLLRTWDLATSNRVDYYVANSHDVAKRIEKIYQRETTVIYPPVRCSKFSIDESAVEDWFLIVSRLVPYKRIDIAIEAFNRLCLPLIVVGGGRDKERLQSMAKTNIEFVGKVSEEELKGYYRKCKAFIFTGKEDFGITSLEAQASGRPVIAYAAGGALETIVEDVTGIFFYEQTSEALLEAIKNFNASQFDSTEIREHAMKFDVEVFKEKIKSFVEEKWQEYRKR